MITNYYFLLFQIKYQIVQLALQSDCQWIILKGVKCYLINNNLSNIWLNWSKIQMPLIELMNAIEMIKFNKIKQRISKNLIANSFKLQLKEKSFL